MGKPDEEEELYRWVATVTRNDGTEEGIQFEEFADLAAYLGNHFDMGILPWRAMISYGSVVNIPVNCGDLATLIGDTGEIVESGPDWNDITSLTMEVVGLPSLATTIVKIAVELQVRTKPPQPVVLH